MGMEKEDQQRFFDCGCLPDDMAEDDGVSGSEPIIASAALR